MAKAEVFYCQKTTCDGCEEAETCTHVENVKHRQNDKTITQRTCPECGYVNKLDALNCVNCDYPLVI